MGVGGSGVGVGVGDTGVGVGVGVGVVASETDLGGGATDPPPPPPPPANTGGPEITVNREKWLQFFQANDGLVRLHATGMNSVPRAELYRRIQGELFDPEQALTHPRKARQPQQPCTPPVEQHRLFES